MSILTTVANNPLNLIAGRHAGIKVRCAPLTQKVYDKLEKLAAHNYWAHLSVSAIESLTAGRAHRNDIFIKQSTGIAYGNGRFIMTLPGCIATFERRSNGEFILWKLEADTNNSYFSLQKNGKKPGLHKATKGTEGWSTSFVADGQILQEKDRVVAITDSGRGDVDVTADKASHYIIKAPISGGEVTVNNNGFDMHHTPGDGNIGGWRNAKKARHADTDPALHESALLLAKTMYDARDIEGVRWISERGGSGVLTQAMRILVDQGVKLDKHNIFLANPTTDRYKAEKLGLKLGLRPARSVVGGGFTPNEIIGSMGFSVGFASYAMRMVKDDDYDAYKLTGDVVGRVSKIKGAVTTGAAITTALGISSAVAMPSAMIFASAVLSGVGLSSTVAKNFLPDYYNKFMSKF